MKKKVCVVTSTRAEFGLLEPLIRRVLHDSELELQLVVTGTHLVSDYGNTQDEIERAEYPIIKKIFVDLKNDSEYGVCRTMSLILSEFSKLFDIIKPQVLILLGDRYEIFAVATAAMLMKVPIAHIHGGETTEGAYDEIFRHCITKMSYLHFACAEEYRRRIVQLGESPDRVFNVGALGVENIKSMNLLSKSELEKELNFVIDENTILVTFHPETLEKNTAEEQINPLLAALDNMQQLRIIFTKSNADKGGRTINKLIDQYVCRNSSRAVVFASLGRLKYLSAVKHVAAVVGNSSSGIIEVPVLRTPTVNIGDRQKGRIRCYSIIDCTDETIEIEKAVLKAVSKEFWLQCQTDSTCPYEQKDTSLNIINYIKKIILEKDIDLKKSFYDLYPIEK